MDDVLIIGGSAAGSAAAVYLARQKTAFRMISVDLGGEVAQSGEVENWPGTIHTTGIELATAFEKHVRSYDFPLEVGVRVTSVARENGSFRVAATKDGQPTEYRAKALIIATGVHPRELGVPGERELKNKGLSYCTVCDGPLYRNKRVVTIGGGNSALESAILLAGIAKEVTLINKNPQMKGETVLMKKLEAMGNVTMVMHGQTTRILGETYVTGVAYTDTLTQQSRHIDAEGVFVHIGMIPNSSFIDNVEKNQFGEIVTNGIQETSVPGIFAAGDVTTHPFKQIVIATGQGVTAALQATRYIHSLAS